MQIKTKDLNAPTLRSSVGGLCIFSLCQYFDRQQRMLRRVLRNHMRTVPLNLTCVHSHKCRPAILNSNFS